MINQSELALLRIANPKSVLPGVDTPTGNLTNTDDLIQLSGVSCQHSAPFFYNAATNTITVTQNGAVLNGFNFGTASVAIDANNVTVENSTFNGTTGWYSINQAAGNSGAVIENNTFTGGSAQNPLQLAAFIGAQQNLTISGNSFFDAPGDAIDFRGGTVTGNYFSGAGYSSDGTHPDAMWLTDTQCPTVISDNFVDWTWANGSTGVSDGQDNDCLRVTTEQGSVSNVTVSGNVLIGGASVIDAGNTGTEGTFSNINITNNVIGFGTYFDIKPGPNTGVSYSDDTILDFTNPIYSSKAWAAYKANGVQTTNLEVSNAGDDIVASSTGTTTLYGDGTREHLTGGTNETIFVGGFGTQWFWGGSGKNVFTYLAISDSTATGGEDCIGNFHASQDVIDLSRINANPADAATEHFQFIGAASLTSAGGQIDYYQNASLNETFVQVSLVGDASADMVIRIGGLVNLTSANFALGKAA